MSRAGQVSQFEVRAKRTIASLIDYMQITIKKGLDVPISGRPAQTIGSGHGVHAVGLTGSDYVGLKPRLLVAEGERVALGQPLFIDKANPKVQFTAPGTGVVAAINRGARRALQGLVIELDEAGDDARRFTAFSEAEIASADPQALRDQLQASGMWTALRTRPFSRIPQADAEPPRSIFVTAIDTRPLAPDPQVIIAARPDDFLQGLSVLARLGAGAVHVCTAAGVEMPLPEYGNIQSAEFEGPHPAGLPGTHIHFLDPVGSDRTVWHIGYQDVIAIGHLFKTGTIDVRRVISLAGPIVREPRLLETRLGARISDLTAGEVNAEGEHRVISGCVLTGRKVSSNEPLLGRYHNQVSAIAEQRRRWMFGWTWVRSGFSFASPLTKPSAADREKPMTTTRYGRFCAMVPIGSFERVMPLDVLPAQLLRALLVRDTDRAQLLGALELDEEDLALSSFVCPAKQDYGAALRVNLSQIEREG